MRQHRSSFARALPEGNRWREPFSILQTNLQVVDAGIDVEAVADLAERSGADTWLLNAGGILSFYPTDLAFQTRNPLLSQRPSGDLFGDAVAAARARGLEVIARLDMSKVSEHIASEHPEWLYRHNDGSPQVYNSFHSTCPNGQYYQERSLDVVDEILSRYDVRGIFLNWFLFNEHDYHGREHGPCHCVNCQEAFSEFSGGLELPEDSQSERYPMWKEFTARTLARLSAKISDHVSASRPDVGVVIRRDAPIVYIEGNNAFRGTPDKDFWPFATAEAVSATRSSREDVSVLVNACSFVDAPYRLAAEEPAQFAQYLIQGISRGGNPSLFVLGAPGRGPVETTFDAGVEVARHHASHRAVYKDLRSTATVGLIRPSVASAGSRGHRQSVEEFRGIYQTLLEHHVCFDVIDLDALENPGLLERYTLVILPNLGSMAGSASTVDNFISQGGNVLTTGSSGLSDEGTMQLQASPALTLIELVEGSALRSSYVTPVHQAKFPEYAYEAPLLPVAGAYLRLSWDPLSTRVGSYMHSAPWGPPELAFGHAPSADPAVVERSFGKGKLVMIPWTPGSTYREFGKTAVRDFLAGIIVDLHEAAVSAGLPESVELIAGSSNGDDVFHLINHSGIRRRSYVDAAEVSGGTLRLHDRGALRVTAHSLRGGIQLPTRTDGTDCVIDLPVIGPFDVILVRTEGPASLTKEEEKI